MKAFTVSVAVILIAAQATANGVCGANTREVVEKASKQTAYVYSCTKVEATKTQEEESLEAMSDEEILQAFIDQLPPNMPDDVKNQIIENFKKQLAQKRQALKNAPKEKSECGVGTGIVLGPNTIITNAHVVMMNSKIAQSVQVRVGKRKYEAQVLGVNQAKDLAALAIDPKINLIERGAIAAGFENSDNLYRGQAAFALGQPIRLEGTLTSLIVSYNNRAMGEDGVYSRYVQLNGDIYSGNSGGPTFDCNANIIGINTAILTPDGRAIGVGLAIPSNTVVKLAPRLFKEKGFLAHETRLGIETKVEDGTADIDRGAYVTMVEEGSLAASMGIKVNDLLLTLAGTEIDGPIERIHPLIGAILTEHGPGDEIQATVQRDGKEVSLSGTVGVDLQKK